MKCHQVYISKVHGTVVLKWSLRDTLRQNSLKSLSGPLGLVFRAWELFWQGLGFCCSGCLDCQRNRGFRRDSCRKTCSQKHRKVKGTNIVAACSLLLVLFQFCCSNHIDIRVLQLLLDFFFLGGGGLSFLCQMLVLLFVIMVKVIIVVLLVVVVVLRCVLCYLRSSVCCPCCSLFCGCL